MAKKSRRSRAKHKTDSKLAKRETQMHAQPLRSVSEPKATVPLVKSSPSSTQAARYQYVLPELRRIGVIAGALLLILIVLTFILG